MTATPPGRRPANSEPPPLVSLVIPARNEAASLPACLDSVLAQTYPAGRLEIVIVVAPSTDATLQVAHRYCADDPRVRVVECPHGQTPTVFNHGLAAARGDVIGRVDAHSAIAPDFVEAGVAALQRSGADGVGGVAQFVAETAQGRAIAVALNSPVGAGPASFRVGGDERETDTLVSGLYPRATWERTGPYDETLLRNQDDEWHYRVRRDGGTLLFTPTMQLTYAARESLGRLARQYYQWGEFRAVTIAKHHRPGSPRQLAPALLVAGLAVTTLLGPRRSAVVAGAYLGAITIAGADAARRAGAPRLAPGVTAAIGTMHLAYGTGFWRGVARRSTPPSPPPSDPTGRAA
jgi:succinoglycan biosynthesis protein ExoA